MNVLAKITISKLRFPVEGYIYNVAITRSVDGGNTFVYCGCGKYCKTLEEVDQFVEETKEKENVIEVINEVIENMSKFEMIQELINNEDFEDVADFETATKEKKEQLIDYLKWRADGGHFLNEEIKSGYPEACKKLVEILKSEPETK